MYISSVQLGRQVIDRWEWRRVTTDDEWTDDAICITRGTIRRQN